MSREERARLVRRPDLPPGPLQTFKDALYDLYLDAGGPSPAELAADVAALADELDLRGRPSRDKIHRMLTAPALPQDARDVEVVAAVLARHLNRDATAVCGRIHRLWTEAARRPGPSAPPGTDDRVRIGRPLREVTDPFDYEVHHAIRAPAADLPPLPPYVRRDHDRLLDEAVHRATTGTSGIAVLVGGSSTGKTRACWEALERLRHADADWRLWHPIAPTHAEAALAGLARVGPRTVVWLNDAGNYLADPALGERVAATLRELLREPARGPVLVLATMWTSDWAALTDRPDGGGVDRRANVRALLAPHRIKVPDAFTGRDREILDAAAGTDPRLAEAATRSRDGRVTQYLAGGPMLLERFEHAPPEARALVTAAMDARRLGCGPYLPAALLEQAAPGYLTGSEAEEPAAADRWAAAIAYACDRLGGIPGMLTRVGPAFRAADYLDEFGRRQLAGVVPPATFWAAAAHADAGDVVALADAARARGLLRDAVRLYVHATGRDGCPAGRSRSYSGCAAINVVRLMDTLHPDDGRPRRWAAEHCSLGDPDDVLALLGSADSRTVAALLARNPAARVALDRPGAVERLLTGLAGLGAQDQVDTLLARDPAGQVETTDRYGLVDLLRTLDRLGAAGPVDTLARRTAATASFRLLHRNSVFATLTAVGAREHALALAARAAAEVSFTDDDAPEAVAGVLHELRTLGADAAIHTLLARDPAAHLDVGAGRLELLVEALRAVRADEQTTTLTTRLATRAESGDPHALARALVLLRAAGRHDRIPELLQRVPAARVELSPPAGLAHLLQTLTGAESAGYRAALLARNPAGHTTVESALPLLRILRRLGADAQYETLSRRLALEFPLRDPAPLRHLLTGLRWITSPASGIVAPGPVPHLDLLLARDPAGRIDLTDTYEVAGLITDLRDVGAAGAADRLASRAAEGAPLGRPSGVALLLRALPAGDLVARLLARDPVGRILISPYENHQRSDVLDLARELRAAGAAARADDLLDRLVAAGHFAEFRDRRDKFHWGREPDGLPAEPWRWERD